jgi:hypothetical protein
VLGSPLTYSDDALAIILSARRFVDVRTTAGGPAPAETAKAVAAARDALRSDLAWSTTMTDALRAAEGQLQERGGKL